MGRQVLDVEDDLLDASGAERPLPVVGDGALLAALIRARGGHMRDIVATIQREQDRAIRAPAAGVTLIEGGPGTGKTAVALHRAAYLLYRDRRRYEGGGVLLVGPSPVFMSYVERVLPSLGEDTAELRALGDVVDGVSSDRLDPPALAALKGSGRMVGLLRRAVREGPPDAPSELRIVYGGEVLRVRSAALDRVRRQLHARLHHPNAAGAEVRRALAEAVWAARPEGVAWNAQAVRRGGGRPRRVRAVRPGLVADRQPDPGAALARRRGAGSGGPGAAGSRDADAAALAASWRGEVSVADVALVDELRVLLGEPPRPPKRRARAMGIDHAGDEIRELSTVTDRHFSAPERPPRPDNHDGYAHVLVDEAQDLSPMQWRMLGRRGSMASWTIVGDAAQSAWPDPAEARRAREEALRGKQVRRFHLGTNYRNSAEIFEFAASVVRRAVPDADLPDAVRRTGLEPQHRHLSVRRAGCAGTVVDEAKRLLDLVDGTVGVITPGRPAAEIAAALVGAADARSCRWSTRCGPRGWSTTRWSSWRRRRSRPSPRPACGCSTWR